MTNALFRPNENVNSNAGTEDWSEENFQQDNDKTLSMDNQSVSVKSDGGSVTNKDTDNPSTSTSTKASSNNVGFASRFQQLRPWGPIWGMSSPLAYEVGLDEEVLALLAYANFEVNMFRRECIKPDLNPKYHPLCKADVKSFWKDNTDIHVQIMIDNVTAVTYINNMGGIRLSWDLCKHEEYQKKLEKLSLHHGGSQLDLSMAPPLLQIQIWIDI
ncbi:hypothetical protein HOLleu_28335 [Holothuria leucospilota]|uniref:Uncharacterized protein n=1 Tax=Holothuria leucospilota TaxID=206669 RepID=A0A9Q1H1W6_HOLLE|nr:hypothetical protein HOLleu_28335 [Holothuria leucospilota]